jgi:putative Holliday junction resolvase
MARVLAIDYGKKRVGLAVTDPLKMIANTLETVPSNKIWEYLDQYLENHEVERIVVGYPVKMNNQPSEALQYINPFIKKLQKRYADMPVEQVDERFTSKMAFQSMIDGGVKKAKRRDKSMVDKISANLILQSWMQSASR